MDFENFPSKKLFNIEVLSNQFYYELVCSRRFKTADSRIESALKKISQFVYTKNISSYLDLCHSEFASSIWDETFNRIRHAFKEAEKTYICNEYQSMFHPDENLDLSQAIDELYEQSNPLWGRWIGDSSHTRWGTIDFMNKGFRQFSFYGKYRSNEKLEFGMYKNNYSFNEILLKDKSYNEWLLKVSHGFCLHENDMNLLIENSRPIKGISTDALYRNKIKNIFLDEQESNYEIDIEGIRRDEDEQRLLDKWDRDAFGDHFRDDPE